AAGGALTPAAATVLRVGLAKRPEDRPAGAAELAAALLAALDGKLDPAIAARAERLAAWGPPVRSGESASAGLPSVPASAPSASRPPPGPAAAPSSGPASSSAPAAAAAEDPVSTLAWREAYGEKMRGFFAAAVLLCAGGAAILGFIGRERGPVYFAWACMGGVVGAAWLHRRLAARRPASSVYWPWALAGALSVGPAHSFGLHSAFASVLVLAVFSGGVFRATQRASWVDRRGLVLAAILAAHTLLFASILAGVVPDDGNVAVRQPGAPAWEPVVHHLLLLGMYVAAFAAGNAVDRAQQTLAARARAATLEAARREALLTLARAELDRVLAGDEGGVFSGQRVGPWNLGRLLGRGGMGEVYEARHAESGVRAALKLIRGDRVGDPVFLRLFERETAALRRIASPYVARVLDVGGLDDELPYIAMEYIAGRSLADILRERDRLAPDELRALLRDAGRGLEDVHAAGVVHGDLKPRNVFRTEAGAVRWKLADFGGARFVDAAADDAPRLVVGTAAYMSPEQAAGEAIDSRSDLFSWCLVLYRALVGRPAFTSADPAEALRRLREAGPPDPRACAELPEDLVLALRLGLARRPAERFGSARELCDAFAQALDGRLDERLRRRARELLRREPWSGATEAAGR
ncbi:MAG: serine/threonine protein kinase, partial [Myxococcales bacterium]|nr:serine/threonine protein kinase [Myxococcales bacterium]